MKNNKANDYTVSKSALHTLAGSADAAFLIGKSGAIYQFFESNLGFGACSTKRTIKNGLGENFNRDTIAIEMALRTDRKSGYGVEDPNQNQIDAGKYLAQLLMNQHRIGQENLITSYDPVRGISGAHADDFSDEVRTKR